MIFSSRNLWAEVASLFDSFDRQLAQLDVFSPTSFQGASRNHQLSLRLTEKGIVSVDACEIDSEKAKGEKRLSLKLDLSSKNDSSIIGSYTLSENGVEKQRADLTVEQLYGAHSIPDEFKGIWSKVLSAIHSEGSVSKRLGRSAAKAIQSNKSSHDKEDTLTDTTDVVQVPEKEEFEKIIIRCQDRADLSFTGKLLAHSSSVWYNGRRKAYSVFQTKGGKYVFLKTGQSARLGELDRNEASHSNELKDAIEFFGIDPLSKDLFGKLDINPVEELD